MNYETVIFEKRASVALITLNRPAKKNALTEQMHRELIHIYEEIERSDELRVVVLTGGSEFFCTGADLSDVSKSEDGLPTGPNAIERLADLTKPTIAAICGWCVAGGLELALSCDLRVVAETAKIGDRHIRIGFIGGAGAPTRLARLIGVSKALELILTGDTIDGNEAHRIGFANRVFPVERLMDGAIELAAKIAAHSPLALQLSKNAVKAAGDSSEYQSLHTTHQLLLQLLSSAEYKAQIAAFLSKGKS
jgi:enoyl-CoA hydratase/carnithine racemase